MELHEGLDLERGWLIHKNWWTVLLWWVALILIFAFGICAMTATQDSVPRGLCLKLLYAILISLFWFGVFGQMYGTRLQIEQN